ncbi:aminotransferase [Alsobacter metallidurans]|uniref:aspartate transaminase n=2 Tax=Alsobacter metallidurans TaxID=340221 RepID=A0A917I4U3_9HYPH|nr:aminotransferase [Alsobacter metallidurans]
MTDLSTMNQPSAEAHAEVGQFLLSAVRPEAAGAPESGIVEVFNYGRGRQGLIPLWVGEGDMPTPGFIQEAATRSLAAGETFYTYQRGLPELRSAISTYMSRLYGRPLDAERFFVTIGGMHALQMAIRIAAGVGDEALIPSPAWPNFLGAVGVAGATPVEVPMAIDPVRNRWSLDVERLAAAVTPRTKLIIVNSPANPTGWTATREELEAILALARRHGLWIVADEIYGRFVFDGAERAPSFHDIMAEEDRILFVQTFSKNWAMTGWRIGWLECHPALGQVVENLMQYSCSGVPAFIQRAGVVALEQGEGFVQHQIERVRRCREIICDALSGTGKVEFADPAGAFYLFFSIRGEADTRRRALRLVDDANVGIAPGTAFGAGGEQYFRLCFARRPEDIQEAARRLSAALAG